MEDCKHESFVSHCMVCWVKLSQGVPLDDAPIRNDAGTEQFREDCLGMAIAIGVWKCG